MYVYYKQRGGLLILMCTALLLLADKVLKGTEQMDGTQIVSMTVIGLLVVFSALLLLVIFLCCSGSIFKALKPGAKKPDSVKKVPAPAKPAVQPAAKAQPAAAASAQEDDSEVVAVIMAAIAAMGAADGTQYAVRSVRQVTRGGSGRNLWAQAGLNDATRPF